MGSREQRRLLGSGFKTLKERRNSCPITPLEKCPPIRGEETRITGGSPRKKFSGWLAGSEFWGRQQSPHRGLGEARGAYPPKKASTQQGAGYIANARKIVALTAFFRVLTSQMVQSSPKPSSLWDAPSARDSQHRSLLPISTFPPDIRQDYF